MSLFLLLLLPVTFALYATMAVIGRAVAAPVGYEDARGFHFGDEPDWSDSEF